VNALRSLFVLALLLSAPLAEAASGKIIKVLPHLLDAEGRHTIYPSLYERDAYQAYLRQHPGAQSGLRFDVQWKGRNSEKLQLRLELRGSKEKAPTQLTLTEGKTKRGLFSNWTRLPLAGEERRKFGDLVAWRATLWEGDQMIAEQKSFLW
jgi:hypothetical protein